VGRPFYFREDGRYQGAVLRPAPHSFPSKDADPFLDSVLHGLDRHLEKARHLVVVSQQLVSGRVAERTGKSITGQGGPNMAKQYVVKLDAQERMELERVVNKGEAAAWKIQRSHALPQCDQGPEGPG
jgi:hypothetical protein